MENEMTVYEPEKDLSMARPPNIVLEEAKTAAKALGDILSKKKKPVIMNGEQYLEFEDWQTVGRFYGITAKEDEDAQIVEIGGAIGFKASSVALRSDGAVISRATAYCMNDEQNWKTKPLFQLASMAQTRANSKALRNVLAWVVVLAGYKPTPAEEMEGVHKESIKEPQKKPNGYPSFTVALDSVEIKTGKKKDSIDSKTGMKKEGESWTLYIVHAAGEKYNTFSDTFGKLAQKSIDEKINTIISWSETDKGKKLESIVLEDTPEPGSEG